MDELNIVSKFTRNILSKVLERCLSRKFGFQIGVQLNNVRATVTDGNTHVRLDIELDIPKAEAELLMNGAGL